MREVGAGATVRQRRTAASLLACAASLLSAAGAIHTVTNLNDSGTGSLRDAIAAAAAGDTIQFGVTGTITLTSDQLTVNKNLTITGPGPGSLAVTFSGFGRAFWIPSGTVHLSGMTIRDCNEFYGSALLIHAGAKVNVTNCLIHNNMVHNEGNILYPNPGVIQNLGTLVLTDCTLLGNKGDRDLDTSAVRTMANSSLTIQRCTFHSNKALGVHNAGLLNVINSTFYGGSAGGIVNSGSATITSCTFTGIGFYGPLSRDPGSLGVAIIRNNIFATRVGFGNSVSMAGVTTEGYNLFDEPPVFPERLNGPGDQIQEDLKLDAHGLVYNGGYTGTVALASGSPALDKGKAFGITTDQRGQPRTIDNPEGGPASGGDGTDIGAYEAPTDALQPGEGVVVTTLADHDDGVCGARDCTLREAVSRANLIGTYDPLDISFAPGLAGTLTLDRNLGELMVTKGVKIVGPGARILSVSGGGYIRILNIAGRSSSLSRLTFRDGWRASGEPGTSNQGGAILNQSPLLLEDCAFEHNYVAGVSAGTSGPGGSGRGGAIYNSSFLRLTRCTFSNGTTSGNVASGAAGASRILPGSNGGSGGAGQGGALYNASGGKTIAENCTFFGNSVSGGTGGNSGNGRAGSGGEGGGGAIYSLGDLTLTSCTLSGNFASGGAGGTVRIDPDSPGRGGGATGGLAVAGGVATVSNNLCAANLTGGKGAQNPDIKGTFLSLGFNLIGTAEGSSGLNQASDQIGTDAARIDPKLGPLANNGGETDSLAPQPGSPAQDRGKSFHLNADQRGVTRPINNLSVPDAPGGDASDIGAVEGVPVGPQPGPTFVVNTVDDHNDGVCSYLDTTLREAIHAANVAPGPNTIVFAATIAQTMNLKSPLPAVTEDLVVQSGARLTISGANAHRVFTFLSGASEISGINIVQGSTSAPERLPAYGGGIFNSATLRLTDCNLDRNSVLGGSAVASGDGGDGLGGAVFNSGVLTLERCGLIDNVAQGGQGAGSTAGDGGGGSGGAIFNDLAGVLTLIDCTLARNTGNGGRGGNGTASGGNGGVGYGGIFNQGTLTLTSCTVSMNKGSGGVGGLGNPTGIAGSSAGGIVQRASRGFSSVANCIVSGNSAAGDGSASDTLGAFTSAGHNLIGIAAPGNGFTQRGDLTGTVTAPLNARLQPPSLRMSRTSVMPINLSSPAIDQGRSGGLDWDQRGMPRRVDTILAGNAAGGDGADIGAFEFHLYKGDAIISADEVYSDGDRLPDDYEVFHGLNPYNSSDGELDSDHDGVSNEEEWAAGTHPRDATSALRIHQIHHLGNSVRIRFGPVIPFYPYLLEYKNAPEDPVWLMSPGDDAFGFPLAGQGEHTDPTTAGRSKRIYRVRTRY